MSLYLYRTMLRDMERTFRIIDQHFNVLKPFAVPSLVDKYVNTSRTDTKLEIDKNKFSVSLDVQHFLPEELKVKVSEGSVTVEGSHEEKEDGFGSVSRRFVRRYILPEGFDASALSSSLSSDGVLTVSAPRLEQVAADERTVPVSQTGQPHSIQEQKQEQKKEE